MKMTKQDAIEKLNALVSRIPGLERQRRFSEDFKKWKHDCRAALKHIFPNEKEYAAEFDEISYSLSIFSDATPDERFEEAFRSGLRSARAMLQSRIDEVSQFWPDAALASDHDEIATKPKNPELVFVIHGRQLVSDFHHFLRALGLKPLEWSQARNLTDKTNPYTWEIVDTALSNAGAIVALMTPDDEARLMQHLWSEHENVLEKELLSQPRQNVLFEAGVAYGRAPERTLLVRVGAHRPMSDLAGHHILQLDDSPQSRQAVAEALRTAGCPVDVSGSEWFRAGNFSLVDRPKGTEKERRQAEAGQIKQDADKFLSHKTRLKGFTDLAKAAMVVGDIHGFFMAHPQYLNASTNRAFLEKYPADFRDKVLFDAANRKWASLEELKRDVDLLRVDAEAAESNA